MKKMIKLLFAIVLIVNSFFLISCSISDLNNEKTDHSSITINNENIEMSFSDVEESDWFYSDVNYVKEKGLMSGVDETHFSPDTTTTRGMIVAILWRLEGEPVEKRTIFSDVSSDSYYYNAVAWASKHQIVSGYDEKTFAPDDTITREQLATILYRYAKYKKVDVTTVFVLEKFADKDAISDYAVEAVNWANHNGIIEGTELDSISPKVTATRCQVAAVLKRLCESILDEKGSSSSKEQQIEENEGKEEITETKDSNVDSKREISSSDYEPSLGDGGNHIEETDDHEHEEVVVEQPIIKVNTAYGKPGDIIEVSVDLQKNPGILGMILSLEYDETAMKLVNAENGEAVSEVLALTTSKTLTSGVRFVWDGLDVDASDIKNGELLKLEFEISDTATIGKRCPLKISYNPGDIVDAELNEVNLSIYQGYVEIEESEEEEF